jgi:hypothetical protein
VVGIGPLEAGDQGTLLHFERPHRIAIDVGIPYLGIAHVEIDVQRSGDGSLVTLEEGIRPWVPSARPLFEPALHLRNSDALRRLKALVEGGSGSVGDTIRAFIPPPHWLEEPSAEVILKAAETCYLAIDTKSGPHVTPVAFAVASGRLWTVVPRDALKTRIVRKRPSVGLCIRAGGSSLSISGCGEILDPARVWDLPGALPETLLSGPALAAYGVRNARRLAGYFMGSPGSLKQLMPAGRVLLAIRPDAVAISGAGGVVAEHGQWPRTTLRTKKVDGRSKPRRGPATEDLPERLGDLIESDLVSGVVALSEDGGPIVLPATWSASEKVVRVKKDIFSLVGGTRRRAAALCLDVRDSGALEDQQGVMLRGEARILGHDGKDLLIAIDAEKTTFWQGAYASTVPA